ncbi:MAG TPA: NmrA/HSCARG family protein [Armatimonadota bacterium]
MADGLQVLVIGATGKQGGHVARLLLRKGHRVRAFTRHPTAPAAQELAQLGAEIAVGDLTDRASLERAGAGVDAIFAMSTPFQAGLQAEVAQGIAVADAAKALGVYLVFSSVASANQATGIPHFDTKWQIEQHIARIGVEAAILAPVYLMENVIVNHAAHLREGVYPTPLPPTLKVQQIALDDNAAFDVLALEQKARFVGKRIDLASDDPTEGEVADTLSRIIGKPIKHTQIPLESVRMSSADAAIMYAWFARVGYNVDIPALHRAYPEIAWHSYESWVREQDWQAILGS